MLSTEIFLRKSAGHLPILGMNEVNEAATQPHVARKAEAVCDRWCRVSASDSVNQMNR